MEVTGAGQFLPQLKQWVSLHPDHDLFLVPQFCDLLIDMLYPLL